jgi:hypothetical protein
VRYSNPLIGAIGSNEVGARDRCPRPNDFRRDSIERMLQTKDVASVLFYGIGGDTGRLKLGMPERMRSPCDRQCCRAGFVQELAFE